MANNLKKFTTEAEYSAATLSYPAVSWVTSGDTVHFDKEQVNDKVIMAFTSTAVGEDIILYNGGSSDAEHNITSITVNDVAVTPIASVLDGASVVGDYLIKYGLADDCTEIFDAFTGDLGYSIGGSENATIEFLIPSQIQEVNHLPSNEITKLVIEATTPPNFGSSWSSLAVQSIYVPDNAITAYQNTIWNDNNNVYPLSQYEGNLPV